MRKNIIIISLIALAFIMVGCADIGTAVEVTVVNNSSYDFMDLYISDTTDDTWGNDLLEPDMFLDPGDTVTVTASLSNPMSVDVKVEFDLILSYSKTGTGLDATETIYITDTGIRN